MEINSKQLTREEEKKFWGTFEYQMSRTMAENLLRTEKSKRRPQEVLCQYVNQELGIKGYCTKVIVEL